MHPYSTTPKDALNAVKETRKIMAQFKDKKAKLWITEIGWATGGDPTPLTVSPQRQAAYLRKTYSDARGQPEAAEDRRSHLVLVARPARRHLVQPHRPVHADARPEAGLGRVRRPDRRFAGLRRD